MFTAVTAFNITYESNCFWGLNIASQFVEFSQNMIPYRIMDSAHAAHAWYTVTTVGTLTGFANMYRAYEILFSARQTFSICDFQFKLLSTIKPSNFAVSTLFLHLHVLFLMSIWSLNLFRNTLILVLLLGYLISA